MRALLVVVVAVALACACGSPPAANVPRTPGSAMTVGFTHGIGFGSALDAPSEGEWGVTLRDDHFAAAKAVGLDHVRLPVRFSAHAGSDPPYAIDEAFFRRVDWAIERAHAHRLSILIDLHPYEELMKDPPAHSERFLGLWKQIAARYASMPPDVAFELLNEPNGALRSPELDRLVRRAIAIVREKNPTRAIVVDAGDWGSAEHLGELDLPDDDPNVVASFHMYQPLPFTHQGAEWMPAEEYAKVGIVFPGESGTRAIDLHFAIVDAWTKRTGRRVYMGELGVIDRADPESRARWVRYVIHEAEKRGIGWAIWDDGRRMKALDVDRRAWLPWIVPAISSFR